MGDFNEKTMPNRDKAIIEADKIDNQIIEALKKVRIFELKLE